MAYSPDTNKIDSTATLGLSGTANSLAYRVHEIEKHFHNMERWYGDATGGSGSPANNLTSWTLTAGTTPAYGTAVKLLSANDVKASDYTGISLTPVKFDLHRIMCTAFSATDKLFVIQFYKGDPAGGGTLLTEVPIKSGAAFSDAFAVEVMMPRVAVTDTIYAQVKSDTTGATLSFIIGIHAYEG